MIRMLIYQFIYIACSSLICFLFRDSLDNSNLSNTINMLTAISAALFTLAGIWIAYIYPKAINAYTDPKKFSFLSGTEHTENVADLVVIVISSALILLGILIFTVISSFLFKAQFITSHQLKLDMLSHAFIYYLALNQCSTILGLIKRQINFVKNLYKKKAEIEVERDLDGY